MNQITCRLRLAMLHYNENNGRNQAETQAGEKQYSISYPKYKSGGYIVRTITEKCTYGKLITGIITCTLD